MIELAVSLSSTVSPHVTSHSADVNVQAWQVINLIGAPLLALLFAPPVIDDIRAWFRSRRDKMTR